MTSKNVSVLQQNEGNIGKSTQDFLRPEGNLKGRGDGFPNSFGGVRTFSHHQSFCREWIRKSFPVDREGLTTLVKINDDRECQPGNVKLREEAADRRVAVTRLS